MNFLGNGSGFSSSHNNAYYVFHDELVLIDLSMLNIQKALDLQKKYKKINIIITHMHDDHVSGIGLYAQYLYYVYKKKLSIYVPEKLVEDLNLEFKLKGISRNIVNIHKLIVGDLGVCHIVCTKHAPELDGKCFGYVFHINNKYIVYTGDTCCLQDFEEYFDIADEIFVDCSYKYGAVHLLWEDVKEELFSIANKNKKVYLMHIDDMSIKKELENIQNIQIAEVVL